MRYNLDKGQPLQYVNTLHKVFLNTDTKFYGTIKLIETSKNNGRMYGCNSSNQVLGGAFRL